MFWNIYYCKKCDATILSDIKEKLFLCQDCYLYDGRSQLMSMEKTTEQLENLEYFMRYDLIYLKRDELIKILMLYSDL
jgi:DNA-directed RNA polymerase subunit RPC12/RpoP